MQNECVFSADRRYRYVLKHTWEPLFPKLCTWIGLNPSIADEQQLERVFEKFYLGASRLRRMAARSNITPNN
jgi:hypothetical protein